MDKLELLDNREKIERIDKRGMLGRVAGTPEMIQEASSFSCKGSPHKISGIKQVLFSGMGGSAIAGDIASDLLQEKSELPFFVNRSYRLPGFVGPGTLFLALSYSGDTEETVLSLKEAAVRKAKIICITSGGKLKEIADKNKYPLYLIPSGYQPREALPYLLFPALKTLEQSRLFSWTEGELEETVALLQKLKREYGPENPLRSNPVKQLAKKLLGKIPVIFAVAGSTGAAGLRLKTQFNENSEVTALFNLFPELNHNEIVNLSSLEREGHHFSLIFLRDEADHQRIAKRTEITKSLIGSQLGGVNEIWAQGKSQLAKILSLIYFGDLLSIYLAVLRGIDPTPVEVITRLKKELAR